MPDWYNPLTWGDQGLDADLDNTGIQRASSDARALAHEFGGRFQRLIPQNAPYMTPAAMAAAGMDAATIDPTQQAQFRADQQGLVSSLQDIAAGRGGPSVAENQLARTLGRNISTQNSLAAGARGPNMALARRTAAMNVGQLGAVAAADAATLRAQEADAARARLGDVLAAGRGADIGLATSQADLRQQAAAANAGFQQQASAANAGFQQQAGATNLGAKVETRAQNIGEAKGYREDILGAQKLHGDAEAAKLNAQAQTTGAALEAKGKSRGGLLGAGGAIIASLSDRRAKTDVHEERPRAMAEFLSAVNPSEFKYKGEGVERHGVIAQDLEKSRIGRTLIRESPGGKAVDLPSSVMALMGATAHLHDRLRRLEGG
jgi:hypothetical protein